MRQFKEMYSNYDIRGVIGNAEQLREMLEKGELDIAFSGISPLAPECIEREFLFDERLYIVVSEQMAQENLAACFSLTMYLPHLYELNRYNDNKRQVFPIKDLAETNPVYILTNKDKRYVEGTKEFKDLLKNVVKSMEHVG